MPLKIRQAEPADHAALEALLRRASLATGEHVQALLDNPDALKIDPAHVPHSLVAERAGRIVGFCTLLQTAPGVAEVDAVFIDPDAWRAGIGALLMGEAERHLAREGVQEFGVVSSQYAERFYRSLGYEPTGTVATRFGPATRLVKRIG